MLKIFHQLIFLHVCSYPESIDQSSTLVTINLQQQIDIIQYYVYDIEVQRKEKFLRSELKDRFSLRGTASKKPGLEIFDPNGQIFISNSTSESSSLAESISQSYVNLYTQFVANLKNLESPVEGSINGLPKKAKRE